MKKPKRTYKTVLSNNKNDGKGVNTLFNSDNRDMITFSKALSALEETPLVDIEGMVESYNDLYHHLIVHRGRITTLRTLKSLHSSCTRYACSHEFAPIPFMKSDKSGLPLMAGPFKSYLRGTINERRTALTILSLFKIVKVEVLKYDTSTITKSNPFDKYVHIPRSPGRFLLYAGNLIGLDPKESRKISLAFRDVLRETYPDHLETERVNEVSKLNKLHMSGKSGPNGPSMGTIPCDYVALKQSPDLYDSMKFLATAFKHECLIEIIKNFENDETIDQINLKGKFLHSRLRVKSEAGAKARVFAIGDWFSQSCLKGMHLSTSNWLINQPEDGTHDQDRVSNVVRDWSKAAEMSIDTHDITAATDSLPANILREIQAQKYGEDIASHWFKLMTKRTFIGPQGESIVYSVGQPMGLFTSFTSLAEWHHLAFRTAIKLSGLHRDPDNLLYVVLGDDSANINVLTHYYLLILKMCQMDISHMKGFSDLSKIDNNPPTDCDFSVAEFAKRVFINGYEVSGISPVLILEGTKYPTDFCDLLRESERRGNNLRKRLPRVVYLAELCFKTRLSLESASFPIWPVPPLSKVRGGVVTKKEWNTLTEKYDLIWNKFKIKELRYWTRKHLLDKLNSAIGESKYNLNSLLEDLYNDKSIACPKYNFHCEPHVEAISYIVNDILNRINLIHSEIGSSNQGDLATTGEDELKGMVASLMTINDLNDVTNPTNRQYLSTESRLSRLNSDVSKQVGMGLPLFTMSGSLAGDQVRIVTIDSRKSKSI